MKKRAPLRLLIAFCAGVSASAARAENLMPVFRSEMKVLFQGDSITDGGRARTGNDLNHTMGQNYAYIVSAEIGAQFPERNLLFINRGIGGNTVVDAAKRWQKDTLDLKPDLLSILLGVNDTFKKGETVEEFEKTFDQLLADTVAALPAAKIVLGQPFLLPVGKHKELYEAEMVEVKKRQDVVARLAEKYHFPLIAYQKAFDEAAAKSSAERWSWDGIHPTYAGHALMAKQWLRTVNTAWDKP